MSASGKNPVFALVDGNNFFVSCERLFNPALRNKPVVVLSNNDGCIISRSEEAKGLGIPMGAPLFKYAKLIKENNVAVFSSNFQLYGDISRRIMQSLKFFTPDMEVYSIDEAFLRLDKFEGTVDILEYAKEICQRVEKWVGIPLSIGIGPTKTLAKLANHMAKRAESSKVFDLRDRELQEVVLSSLAVNKTWGVGHRMEKKLHILGILTVLDLQRSNSKMIRSKFSVIGERIVMELRGISCLDLEMMQPRRNILSSRSFGTEILQLQDLEEAVANYVARAALKLRKQKSKAQGIYVFIRTNRLSKTGIPYTGSATKNFINPTNDTRELIVAAKEALREIYSPRYKYKKAGVMLLNLIAEEESQLNFFSNNHHQQKSKILMSIIDRVNETLNKEAIFIAGQGVKRSWQMKSGKRSRRFTTHWDEIYVAG